MSRTRKIFLFIALPLVIVFVLVAVAAQRQKPGVTSNSAASTAKTPDEEVVFTHQIFDPTQVSSIIPLGELNGGGSEWQATTGVVINIKPAVVAAEGMINVYAPTEMTLESYSYHRDPRSPDSTDWALIFRVNKNVTLKYDHITQASEKIVAVTTSTPKDRSNEEPPRTKIKFAAGEIVARTHGTKLAKNWNIYMTDASITNKFVNQNRYQKSQIGYRFINGACPFNYYESAVKNSYLALMGATEAGQSRDCGNPSKDVAGTLSGAWFFDQSDSNTDEQLDGNFVSPLAIYHDSANRVIIDQIANTQFRIEGGTDPATVSTEKCYQLTDQASRAAGYAYFKLVGSSQMQLAYGASGSCPSSFPATGTKNYYR